ncbi:MAG TPA: protein kinase [Kofleriaceae bacterium]|nr:protein kinase [Kofleriaceae bacterium]
MSEDDTLPETLAAEGTPASPSTTSRTSLASLIAGDDGARYDLGPVLGRGGMGEVRAARDLRMDREVAVKRLRDDMRDRVIAARFVREAQLQGALEHPAIVPVHDLGVDRDGTPFFVMKRLAGTTLADALLDGDARWPRRLLLGRLVDVALALELAHTRGIIHRDVKPSNIMLGDFGEVYVLDWGLAKRDGDSSIPGKPRAARPVLPLDDTHTAEGELLGTPGYMAPEQARGGTVGPPADVFSLGLVLYEIVAGSAALPRGAAGITAVLEATCHRPGERSPDVPPELDALCARATALDPAARPTARELADGIQAYLDGDRDTTRRRELAAEHARLARDAMTRAGDDARALAMREAGRAIALDATNQDAQQVLARLLIDAPETVPAEALAAADHERAIARQHALRLGVASYIGIAALASILLLMPTHAVWPILSTIGLCLVMAVTTAYVARAPRSMRTPWYLVLLGLNSLLLIGAGLIFGPLLAMPILLIGSLGVFLSQPVRYSAAVTVAGHLAPFVLLIGLELVGVLPSTFTTRGGQLVLQSWTLELTPLVTALVLSLVIGAQFTLTVMVTRTSQQAQEAAQDRVHAQRWHLMQLVR